VEWDVSWIIKPAIIVITIVGRANRASSKSLLAMKGPGFVSAAIQVPPL
jgi:hypothetical protein